MARRALSLLLLLVGCSPQTAEQATAEVCTFPLPVARDVRVVAQGVQIGADAELPEEGPPKTVAVDIRIDSTEVTNAQFAEFVTATGYVTDAERPPDPVRYPGIAQSELRPSSLVFVPEATAWRVVAGADWRHPEGPHSSIAQRARHPVVHVSYRDALAYAKWRGRDLPTEDEWEVAARGSAPARVTVAANTWQGPFPATDLGTDGFRAQTAPVGCYAANAAGLHDMIGNVWEWTKTPYRTAKGVAVQMTIKGGSHLCSENFCRRARAAARQPGPDDTGASHVGFRTVARATSK